MRKASAANTAAPMSGLIQWRSPASVEPKMTVGISTLPTIAIGIDT